MTDDISALKLRRAVAACSMRDLHSVAKQVWLAHAEGMLSDGAAESLFIAIRQKQMAHPLFDPDERPPHPLSEEAEGWRRRFARPRRS